MRFAYQQSERCVAVATAKFSLTTNSNGVQTDTSLGFLMKLGCVLVHDLLFFGFLADDPSQKGWLLGRECCSWVWNGLERIA